MEKSKDENLVLNSSVRFTPDFHSMTQIVFWNSFGFLFYGFIRPYIAEVFNATGTTVGVIIALQPFARLFSTPIVGYLTDRTSKKRLVLIGSLGRTISYSFLFISLIINSIFLFGLGIFMQGLIVGFFWPPFNVLISEKSDQYYRSEAFGKRMGQIGWGSLVGSIISFSIFALGETYFPENNVIKFFPLLIFAAVNVYAGLKFYKHVDETLTLEKYLESLGVSQDLDKPSISLSSSPSIALNHIDSQNKTITNSSKLNHKKIPIMLIGAYIAFLFAVITNATNMGLSDSFVQLWIFEAIDMKNDYYMLLLYMPAHIISLLLSPYFGKWADKVKPSIGLSIIASLGALTTYVLLQAHSYFLFAVLLTVDWSLVRAGTLMLQNVVSRASKTRRGMLFSAMQFAELIGGIIGPIFGGILWDRVGHAWPFILSIYIELALIPLFILTLFFLFPFMEEKRESHKINK